MDPTSNPETTLGDDGTMSNPVSTTVSEGKKCDSKAGRTDENLEEIEPEIRQAADRAREFYASGAPFFTKDAIADLARQFERAREHYAQGAASEGEVHPRMLSLQALDGKTVEVENQIGTAWPESGAIESVMVNPLVSYRTYQQLIVVNIDPDIFYPGLAYCPLVLDYDVRERDKTTRNLDTK